MSKRSRQHFFTMEEAKKLLAEAERDPQVAAIRSENERRRAEARRQYDQAAAPVVADLQHAGFEVSEIGEFQTEWGERRFDDAIPVFLKWCAVPELDHRVRDDVLSFLLVPWLSDEGLERVLSLDVRAMPADVAWRWGDLVYQHSRRVPGETLVALAKDRSVGAAREMITRSLGRLRDEASAQALLDLLRDEDPSVVFCALDAVQERKAGRFRPVVAEVADAHGEARVRRRGRQVLKKLP